jgi:hypothetical protein
MAIEQEPKIKIPEVTLEELTGGPVAQQREIFELDKENGYSWRKKIGNIFLASTILAGAMAGLAKKAEAGPHFSQGIERAGDEAFRRGAEGLGRGLGDTMERIFGGGMTVREREDSARQNQQMQTEAVRRGWQKQDEAENTTRRMGEQTYQQYLSELREAKTPEQLRFVRDKYNIVSPAPPGGPSGQNPSPRLEPKPEIPAGTFRREAPPVRQATPAPSRFESSKSSPLPSPATPETKVGPGEKIDLREKMIVRVREIGPDGTERFPPVLIPVPRLGEDLPANVVEILDPKYKDLMKKKNQAGRAVAPEPKSW